ncbi:class II fructose-bisphosphatase [Anaplasma capra]|uniref:class II fructose-bisphosphatase n=1 Tax=Anaplasma capra TaxID=1562740 RepID=UPI0021D5D861|nr:class II fructose-bisphosphatase [Anaplasma capra]MCU7612581.1 class II fructose-bisphosphatase [Anaplasma capra]
MEFLDVTERAAIEAHKFAGRGDEKGADKVAVDSMRSTLNKMRIEGTIVIGEGERDNAPMLYAGEKVGLGGPAFDIAVDPLEGTTTCSLYRDGAMSVIAVARPGCLLRAPDVYMDKIAVGPGLPEGVVSLDNDLKTNLHNLSRAKEREIPALTAVVLKRDRHISIIEDLRKLGIRIRLIDDGDISAVMSLISGENDIYIGIGGAPEGVLSAVLLASVGGQIEGRLILNTDSLREQARSFGIEDENRLYAIGDMVKGDAFFVATGVTDSLTMRGISYSEGGCVRADSIILSPKGVVTRVSRTFYSGVPSA